MFDADEAAQAAVRILFTLADIDELYVVLGSSSSSSSSSSSYLQPLAEPSLALERHQQAWNYHAITSKFYQPDEEKQSKLSDISI